MKVEYRKEGNQSLLTSSPAGFLPGPDGSACSCQRFDAVGLADGAGEPTALGCGALSVAAKERMLSRRGEPLFLADWLDVLMVHYEVDRPQLQGVVPFEL